jgi:hypothetical protein
VLGVPGFRPSSPVIHSSHRVLKSRMSCAGETVQIPDNPNWRRHKSACPYYRERWFLEDERGEDGLLLYQSICLQNTPPLTGDEQEKCMQPRRTCWRHQEANRAARKKQPREAAATGASDGGE